MAGNRGTGEGQKAFFCREKKRGNPNPRESSPWLSPFARGTLFYSKLSRKYLLGMRLWDIKLQKKNHGFVKLLSNLQVLKPTIAEKSGIHVKHFESAMAQKWLSSKNVAKGLKRKGKSNSRTPNRRKIRFCFENHKKYTEIKNYIQVIYHYI